MYRVCSSYDRAVLFGTRLTGCGGMNGRLGFMIQAKATTSSEETDAKYRRRVQHGRVLFPAVAERLFPAAAWWWR